MTAKAVQPGVGLGPFELGMTRPQAWAATRSPVTAFYPQSFSTERTDDFKNLGVHADYDDGKVARIVAFTSNPPAAKRCPLLVLGQELGPECDVDDVVALLELDGCVYTRDDERIDVPALGLVFGFVEKGPDDKLRLEWVSVEVSGRATPFTRAG